MRSLVCSLLVIGVVLAPPLAFAQSHDDTYANLTTAMEAAQAQAVHPGDEALTCDELQAEIVTTMQDPAVQSVVAESGAVGQDQMNQFNAAQSQARAQMGMSIFMGLASSFIPGMGYAQMIQQRAMMAQQQQQAQEQMAQMQVMSDRMATIMPQMMRGQRLYELGQAQQCPFVQAE